MSKIVSIGIYTITINGCKYWTTGRSRKQIAKLLNIPLRDVKIGADTTRIPKFGEVNNE